MDAITPAAQSYVSTPRLQQQALCCLQALSLPRKPYYCHTRLPNHTEQSRHTHPYNMHGSVPSSLASPLRYTSDTGTSTPSLAVTQ